MSKVSEKISAAWAAFDKATADIIAYDAPIEAIDICSHARAALESAIAEGQPRWIPLTEQLPEKGQHVRSAGARLL